MRTEKEIEGTFMGKQDKYKFAVIGGDARQLIAAARLAERGHEVRLYGFGGEEAEITPAVDSLCCSSCSTPLHELLHNLADGTVFDCGRCCATAEEAVEGCDTVILPLPVSKDGMRVSMPLAEGAELTLMKLCSLMAQSGVRHLCGGKLQSGFTAMCEARGINVFDYYEREEFAIANAIPTAEGAIEIAMKELPTTLDGSSALVIGYGRIGKVLSRLLKALGMRVTVSARKPSDLAWIRAEGLTSAETEKLAELFGTARFDVIFNTVPHTVLGKTELEQLNTGTLIVDLASKPGGVDIREAEKLSHNVIWALSLPGKVAPVTSGHIIADTVLAYIEDCGEGGVIC